jgi:single-stranded DNA-binding protein
MTAQIAAWGRLGSAPRPVQTSSGKAMTVGSLAVDVTDPREGDAPPEWFGLVAFGGHADTLAKHAKGECVSVTGRLQRRTYDAGNGEKREQLQIIVESLVSARTVRPGGGGQKSGNASTSKHAAADRAQRPLEHDRGR